MTDKFEQIQRAYKFFVESEKNNLHFQLSDIANATGWANSTINGYRSKKWVNFLLSDDLGYYCKGILTISQDEFVNIHRQSVSNSDTKNSESTLFLEKSREFALLAIQTYNNPIINYRFYGFVIDMIIAYTALFHAIFLREKKQIWYEKNGIPVKIDGDYKYYELQKCLDVYFAGREPAIVSNIELFIKLRNLIEHKNLPNIDLTLSGYSQSLVMNYETLLEKEFGYSKSISPNLALAIQLSDFSDDYSRTIKSIGSKSYQSIKEYIDVFCGNLSPEVIKSENFCFRVFVIPKSGNHATSSDKSIEFVKFDPSNPTDIDLSEKVVGLIREKTVQVAHQGGLLASDVVRLVSTKTNRKFNIPLHTKAWKLYKIRCSGNIPDGCNTKYCSFSEPFKRYLYTKEWVDFLSSKVLDDSEYEQIVSFKN